jgi:predicted nucleic acid-binding protein
VSLVIDASVAAKWVLPEAESDRAEALHVTGEPLVAPTLVLAEIGNAVWKRALQGALTPLQAIDAVTTASGLFTSLVAMEVLARRATEIAIGLRHPVYDCFYLALAERERCTLVTADARLIAAANRLKGVMVRAL